MCRECKNAKERARPPRKPRTPKPKRAADIVQIGVEPAELLENSEPDLLLAADFVAFSDQNATVADAAFNLFPAPEDEIEIDVGALGFGKLDLAATLEDVDFALENCGL